MEKKKRNPYQFQTLQWFIWDELERHPDVEPSEKLVALYFDAKRARSAVEHREAARERSSR